MVAVIALLAAIAVPNFLQARKRSQAIRNSRKAAHTRCERWMMCFQCYVTPPSILASVPQLDVACACGAVADLRIRNVKLESRNLKQKLAPDSGS